MFRRNMDGWGPVSQDGKVDILAKVRPVARVTKDNTKPDKSFGKSGRGKIMALFVLQTRAAVFLAK